MAEEELIAMMMALVTFFFTFKVGIGAWVRRKEFEAKSNNPEELTEAVEDLRREVNELRISSDNHVGELHDRVDFMERLLTKGSRPGSPDDRPNS